MLTANPSKGVSQNSSVVRGNRFKLPFKSTETFCAIFRQGSGRI